MKCIYCRKKSDLLLGVLITGLVQTSRAKHNIRWELFLTKEGAQGPVGVGVVQTFFPLYIVVLYSVFVCTNEFIYLFYNNL